MSSFIPSTYQLAALEIFAALNCAASVKNLLTGLYQGRLYTVLGAASLLYGYYNIYQVTKNLREASLETHRNRNWNEQLSKNTLGINFLTNYLHKQINDTTTGLGKWVIGLGFEKSITFMNSKKTDHKGV